MSTGHERMRIVSGVTIMGLEANINHILERDDRWRLHGSMVQDRHSTDRFYQTLVKDAVRPHQNLGPM